MHPFNQTKTTKLLGQVRFFYMLFFMLSLVLKAQVITPFAIVHQTMQPGGIVFLANTSIGCSANPPISTVTSCSTGANEMPPLGSYKDNDFNAAYIDIDGDASTFMSSSDALNLPVCSQITRAILFWGATGATTSSLTTCKMKVNGGSYQTITATTSQTNNVGFNTFHNYADVTNLVLPGGRQATVTVADIPSNQIGTSNRFGSWCIAVFYKNDLLPLRQLTVFRGLGNVSGTSTVTIPISGFLTPPVGPIGIQLGVYVHDGDRALTGDNLSFQGAASTAGSFVPITDAVNQSNDVMNSTVSFGGTLTPNRVPNMNNTGGLDADIYLPDNSAKNYVGNSATSGTFQLTSGGETYLPQMVTTAIDVYEPDVRASIRARDVNGGLLVPGDIVEYTMKGLNVGSDPSVNTFITDTLDLRAEYIPNSTRIIYGPGTGSLTDVPGDDRLDYNSANRTLKVRIGSGANAVIGGTVNNSSTGVDSTVVTYSVMCTSSCIKIACSPTISAQAYIWATGAISSNTFNNGSNPGIFDGFGCPIPGTTKSPITATACGVPTASNTGPGCEFGTVFLTSPSDPYVTYSWTGPSSFTSSLQNPTLSPVTSGMGGVYTVTLAIPSSTCNAVLSTTLVTAVCTPTSVNDGTVSSVNIPVVGNASSNDLNATGATYSISAQSPNGTVTMGPNGQYTFTPAPSFTGVTTATYAACFGTNCATAVLEFTIHPTIIANLDAVVTTPSVSTTGNLLSNDAGITSTLGATYSVSVTQPVSTTGTFVMNPATGQYTFIPNPAFSGTASTTYTVCNTAVVPAICSSSVINIVVAGPPLAVNDGTNTMQGVSVSGSLGTNDNNVGSTLSPTYTVTQPPSGTGTITLNPATGQYTFAPNPAFTGAGSTTYTVCNVTGSCSSATFSFMVFPTLVANNDVNSTAPTTPTTGNLLTNDGGGAATGATYSVSITQLPSGTGTLVVDPATGQYTLTPNPAFAGTTSTTYTVCNTAVTPSVCSNAVLSLTIAGPPLAVADGTNTIQGVSVNGNIGGNDNGVGSGLNPTYSVTQLPSGTGTITLNSTTGQYTFVPNPAFTGTGSTTYTVCNITGSCSSTTFSFNVFPTLVANSNSATTTPSTSTTGSLLANDAGIVPSATYSVSITQFGSGTGTISINPVNGQYTFTPNPSFTGTTSTTYTVCNTSVNPVVCSNAVISLTVAGPPTAVLDNTTTIQGSPVSGSVGTNDANTNSAQNPTFTITQLASGTGTFVINPVTGQYTFNPNPAFTGTASTTYTVCNITGSCSSTNVNVVVYPTLVANQDIIATTPSVTTTGTLTTNDLGIVSGGTYSVTLTQPSSLVGTISINPSTGQYTFVPNPSYSGTTSTTYTICNTAVNPVVCTNTTIIIRVGSFANATPDFTATPINVPVSGNASSNDSGTLTTLNPVYTNAQPLAGTGTLVMNPTTGQYTFTPASGFTGTTTATYTLCNVLSPPCSTTNITFTVFPALVTNSDVIVTTPSVTTTGTLLTNDLGIAPGGVYSVSVTQPSSGTGTIVVNPTTGQYTFVPNPAFTGTASTTYTVCNTAVTPSVCSTNTVLIQVGTPPVASPDFSTTVINTPVSGNLSSNDTGTLSALNPNYTAAQPQAGTGTLTVDPATGQYTYTPATGFTGTTSANYTLCNVLSPPCSTASITFSVYPAIGTQSDVANTTPSVAVSGSLLINDAGIVNSASLSANYSVFVSQPSPTVGSFVINPSTGQYTFTPNPAFVGTAQTTYTVCNNSVIPAICSSTIIAINVFPNPAPVNDVTTTIINTQVVGNASVNDGGTAGGSYTITGQPANGTITMNPATGQYTFTPTTGFTGVTTATYNLCNGAPVTCSPALITVTVYPLISSTNDTVITTPSVAATGSLLLNDAGIVSGGVYSVTISQPPSTTGSFVIDPATGQYTFTPNPGFTGTVSTTYTVCNTSVSPNICSTATIVITVGEYPLAVNDGTVTMQGISVSGSLSNNDTGASGSLNPAYTIGLTNPSHGTVTINPSTGQYTFVPHPGFTGTTSVTYTLCNVLSPPCSSATVVFTVIPTLVAVNDVISTSASVTVTGNLLQNDNGISSNGVYSITATPVNPSTGTLTIDPVTGNYTFVPNPSFSGSVTTTYTVCNTAVTPVVCSTASITIQVNNLPVAASDGTITTQGVAVTGNASANDAGAAGSLNPAFTVGSLPPGTGTISMNATTGQYTFTPNPGFTGTTSVTYTLCNVNSPPCSTTTITFTVYPTITANPDVIATTPSVTVFGSLVNNDGGVLSGGVYSITVTQPPSTTGTLVVNQSTGQYTFIPHPNYTGTTTTTYTICNTAVIPVVCSSTSITIIVGNSPIANSDGTVTSQGVPVSGSVAANDVGILSSLNPTFTVGSMSPSVGIIVMNPATGQYTFTPVPGFTGTTSVTYVLCNSNSPPCSTTTINFTVFPTLVANPTLVVTTPSASVEGTLTLGGGTTVPGGNYSFTASPLPSTTGTLILNPVTGQYTFVPNPNYTGTTVTTYTVCNNAVTPVVCSSSTITVIVVNSPAKIGIAKSASKVITESNGCYLVTFKFTIKNHGTDTVYQVEAFDNLEATFGTNATYNIVSGPSSLVGHLKTNNLYTGNGTGTNLLATGNKLGAGKADTISLQVRYCAVGSIFSFNNTASVSASNLPSGGVKSTDVSNNGLNSDPNNNGNPSDAGEDTPTTFGADPVVFVPQGFSPNNDGVNDVMKVRGLEPYPNNELTILNRWGNVVYKKKAYDNTWDGTANLGVTFGDNTLPEGTYFYILELGDGKKALKGYIALSRSLTN